MPATSGGNVAASRDTGSQKALRERNTQLVVTTLGANGPQTQAALARRTGLSTGTVSNIVRDLTARGRVTTSSVISAGRRSIEVTLVPDGRVVVGVDVGRTHLRVMGLNTARQAFGMRSAALSESHRPADTLPMARRMLDAMLEEHGIDRADVMLCGLAFPASLEPSTGAVVQASVLPHWAGLNLIEATTSAFALPVVLENDANLGALAHAGNGRFVDTHCLVYLKVGTGIGAGLALDGRLYESLSGISGEIGHSQVVDGGDVCTCGNRGCLETVASTRRLIADLAYIRPGRRVDLDEVIDAATAGEPAVLRLLHDAGVVIGKALAPICNLLSPDVVVVGGPMARVGGPLLEGLVQSARQRSLAAATAHTEFVLSDLADDAEVHGACLLALRKVLTEGDDLVSNR
ncbi:ROK family transcriptional regulator [Cellulomonas edaphi]|uniref:ROK family transcriptional regulator n=1 Tax=Cellulomonas edaphi TaxID=3053468 RepID=A0ABT7SA29_9CELL|nr:ROK family transcriptional regulator [Cellulomons edaphi]MDM7832478.1 ROK family transcriptional regulator [Cellulomons edaphi]